MPWSRDAPDEELMLCYRDGDAGAFDVLYRRHRGGLYRYILRLCANPAVADELFQEVWTNLIRAREQYTVSARFTTYLFRLAHNRVVDYFRAQGNRATVSLDDDLAAVLESVAARRDNPDTALEIRQQAARLMALLSQLPPTQREAFVLQQEAGLTVEEIAEATGVSRETAKSRLRYALEKLRHGMSEWQ